MNRFLTLYGILFAFMICWSSSLGPIDDRLFLLPFDILRCWGNGRFYIFDGIEQFVVLKFIGLHPFLFYLVNAFEFLALIYIIHRILNFLKPNAGKSFSVLIPILISLTPGLGAAYLRLLVPERALVLCFSALVLLDLEGVKSNQRKAFYILVAFFSFFLKEPAFLVVGGLSFFNFIKSKSDLSLRKFHLGLMCMSLLYGCFLFFMIRLGSHDGVKYGDAILSANSSGWVLFIKNILNFALNDPLVLFFSVPAGLLIFIKEKRVDPYLAIIAGYFFVFLVLGLFQEYYLLPMMPFLLVSIIRYGDKVPSLLKRVVALFFFSSLCSGLSQITVHKNIPIGFSKTIDELLKRSPNHTDKICYLGLNSKLSSEVLSSSRLFYAFKTLRPSSVPEFISSNEAKSFDDCEYLIESPFNYDGTVAPENWEIIAGQESVFFVPNFSIKTAIKYFAFRFGREIHNKNFLGKSEFVLLKKK